MRAIITYHSIDDSGSVISTDARTFERHLDWLAREGVAVVPVEQLLALPDTTRAAALTFDDGIASVAEAAAPALGRRGWTGTVFIVSGHVGRDNQWPSLGRRQAPRLPMLTWAQVEALMAAGWTIGAHTRTHPDLPACRDDEIRSEILGSTEDLEEATGVRPRWFAYPYGTRDPRAEALVARTFTGACTTTLAPLGQRPDPHLLPRLDAYYLRGRLPAWGSGMMRSRLALRHGLRRIRAAVA